MSDLTHSDDANVPTGSGSADIPKPKTLMMLAFDLPIPGGWFKRFLSPLVIQTIDGRIVHFLPAFHSSIAEAHTVLDAIGEGNPPSAMPMVPAIAKKNFYLDPDSHDEFVKNFPDFSRAEPMPKLQLTPKQAYLLAVNLLQFCEEERYLEPTELGGVRDFREHLETRAKLPPLF
jgi:hypothetical protein